MKALYIVDINTVSLTEDSEQKHDEVYRGISSLKDECHIKVGVCRPGMGFNNNISIHEMTLYEMQDHDDPGKCLIFHDLFNIEEYHFCGSCGELAIEIASQVKMHTRSRAVLWVDCLMWDESISTEGRKIALQAAKKKGVEICLYLP